MGRGVNADDGCDQGDRCEEDQQEPDQWTFSGRILFSCYHNITIDAKVHTKKERVVHHHFNLSVKGVRGRGMTQENKICRVASSVKRCLEQGSK